MSLNQTHQLSFSAISVNRRKCKHTFFDQINNLINWLVVEKELRLHYPRGLRLSGKTTYNPLLWYYLSDYQLEE